MLGKTIDLKAPTQQLDQSPGQWQPQACTAVASRRGLLDLLKWLQGDSYLLGRHSRPCVCDRHFEQVTIDCQRGGDRSARARKLDRIGQQIGKDLAQAGVVNIDDDIPIGDLVRKIQAARRCLVPHHANALDQLSAAH